MKERPILFKGAMVRAILEGRKTQTRRVINPQPLPYICGRDGKAFMAHNPTHYLNGDTAWTVISRDVANGHNVDTRCKLGMPGDRLWVRETWKPLSFGWCQTKGDVVRVRYAADMAEPVMRATEDQYDATHPGRTSAWKPSIHMPRWASRIMLEITGIRAERLQTISLDDARAEGVETTDRFAALWTDTYGTESWNADPWVWVLEFAQARKEAGV
jgi:hypothetical protein